MRLLPSLLGTVLGTLLVMTGVLGLMVFALGPREALQRELARFATTIQAPLVSAAPGYTRLPAPADLRGSVDAPHAAVSPARPGHDSLVEGHTPIDAPNQAATSGATDSGGAPLESAPAPAEEPAAAPETAAPAGAPVHPEAAAPAASGAARASPGGPITHLTIPSIGLSTGVVVAPLVQVGADLTWRVPAFKAGHAERTAGAGAPGNAVIMGHLTRPNEGSVFAALHRVAAGDTVAVIGAGGEHRYRVVDVAVVDARETSILAAAERPVLTLITCAGTWLPARQDFSHRLIVRAELAA